MGEGLSIRALAAPVDIARIAVSRIVSTGQHSRRRRKQYGESSSRQRPPQGGPEEAPDARQDPPPQVASSRGEGQTAA